MEELFPQIKEVVIVFGLKVVAAIVILIIGIWLAKIISKWTVRIMERREVDPTLKSFASGIIKGALIAFVVIAAISKLGVETASFIAVLGAVGLAIGFALQGSLSNLAAGVMIILFRQIKVGQFIEGAGKMGTIQEIGIFATKLFSPDNRVIYIPNSQLISDPIINFSENDTRRVDLVFGIGYNDDIDKAKSVIQKIIDSDSRILKEPAPQIVVSELADSSVNFNVRPWVKSSDYWGLYWDLTENVKKRFDEEKISIPFPQRDVHVFQN